MRTSHWLRLGLLLGCVALIPKTAHADIKFTCRAAAGMECAYSVLHPGDTGATNFVLQPNQTFAVNDNFAGGRFCVAVSKPRAQVKDWPPSCHNATDPNGFTHIGGPLVVGQTYY
jgi:hypothetical protein